jgi:hypothetical protein
MISELPCGTMPAVEAGDCLSGVHRFSLRKPLWLTFADGIVALVDGAHAAIAR